MNKQLSVSMAIALVISCALPMPLHSSARRSIPWKKIAWRVGVPVALGIMAGINTYYKVQENPLESYIRESDVMKALRKLLEDRTVRHDSAEARKAAKQFDALSNDQISKIMQPTDGTRTLLPATQRVFVKCFIDRNGTDAEQQWGEGFLKEYMAKTSCYNPAVLAPLREAEGHREATKTGSMVTMLALLLVSLIR